MPSGIYSKNLKDLLWLACHLTQSHGGWIGFFREKKFIIQTRIGEVFDISESLLHLQHLEQRSFVSTQGPPTHSQKIKTLFPHYFQFQITKNQALSGLLCCFSSQTQLMTAEHHRMIEIICDQIGTMLTMEAEKTKALLQLASGISHEINNPLAVISGHLEIIKHTSADEIVSIAAIKIEKTIDRIQKIISGLKLLSYNKPGNQIQRVSIQSVVDESLLFYQESLQDKNILLEYEPYPEPIWINCDPTQISQVICNLISNAIDALHSASQKKITIKLFKDSEYLSIQVFDSGNGIPKEILDRIFDPFFSTKGAQGTGLGLSISRGLIQSHHGTLSADNHPSGKGARFTILLPLNDL